MLKKNILFLLLGALSVVKPIACMDTGMQLVRNQAIDDEPVTIGLQDEQVKVQAKYAKLSGTLRNLIDDVGTDATLPIPNVTSLLWRKIQELLPHVFSIAAENVDSQEKERLKTIVVKTIQSYDGATLAGFTAAVNYLDIPALLHLAIDVAKKTGIKKFDSKQILSLPKEIRNPIIFGQMFCTLGPVPYMARVPCHGHRSWIRSVCASSDGNTVVSGSMDGIVHIWNKDGTERAVCKGHTDNVNSVCITPDGQTIVSGSWDGTMRIWNKNGTLRQICNGHRSKIDSVCMSLDGNTIVSGSKDRTVRIWNNDGTQRVVCNGHTGRVRSVCVSLDGNTIVSGSTDRTMRIWNRDGTQRAVCNGHTGTVISVCISADGNTIVSGSRDGAVRMWNNDGTQRAVCNGHRGEVTSVCISADGNTIVSGSNDGTVRIWNKDGALRAICNGHTGEVISVGITPDGNTIVSAGSGKGVVGVWNNEGIQLAECNCYIDVVCTVCISPDGNTIVSGSYDNIVRVWNIEMLGALKNMNTEQAQRIWTLLQLAVLKARNAQSNSKECWERVKAIMEADTTKTAHEDEKVSGGEPVLKRHRSGE